MNDNKNDAAIGCKLDVSPLFVGEKVAAQILGCSVHKLRKDRSLGRGVPFYILPPRTIRYNVNQIKEFMEKNWFIATTN